jgi:hypothetical protein
VEEEGKLESATEVHQGGKCTEGGKCAKGRHTCIKIKKENKERK